MPDVKIKRVYDCRRHHPRPGVAPYLDMVEGPASLLLPKQVDLRPHCPPVYDQGSLGSCVGNALAGDVAFVRAKEKLPNQWTPSRLFIYYNARACEGDTQDDSGCAIFDAVNTLRDGGVCSEMLWPYDAAKFAVKPVQLAYAQAVQHKDSQIVQINNASLMSLKMSLALGWPLVIGFTAYASFESVAVAQTGVLPMPGANEAVLGGHAVMVVGYDDVSQNFIVRNSWGAGWGGPMAGHFLWPYAYATNPALASDCWAIHRAG